MRKTSLDLNAPDRLVFERLGTAINKAVALCLAVLLVSAPLIFLIEVRPASAAGVIISDGDPGVSSSPHVAASGSNVHVIWQGSTGVGNDIFLVSSSNDGADFSDPVNLSNSGGATSPRIAASGSNVHVIWQSSSDIFLVSSSNDGADFSDPVNLSNNGISSQPNIAASGSNVHVVWRDSSAGNFDVFAVSSADDGVTFGFALNVSSTSDPSANPSVAASGSNVHVAWEEGSSATAEIFSSTSTNSGGDFADPVNVSSNVAASNTPSATATLGGQVFVAWSDKENGPLAEIFLSVSDDGGSTFGSPVNLSANAGASLSPQAAIAGDDTEIHVVWQDFTSVQLEVMIQSGFDAGEPSIALNPISTVAPLWDVDGVQASGSVGNAVEGDKVVVEWGDGISENVTIVSSAWGPVEHFYGPDAVGNNTVVARLVSSDGSEKAISSTALITVQPHPVSLTLDQIPSVDQGSDISVQGSLFDAVLDSGIEGETITFSGTGSSGLTGATTDGTGLFSASGPSVNSTEQGLTVQAHYAGSSLYEPADSEARSYNTIDQDADEFPVSDGEDQHVDLVGYNATIDFQNVQTGGSLFVSTCSAPDDERFEALADRCLSISPGFQMGVGSVAFVNVSYAGASLPTGFTEDDINLFHESGSGEITDITFERNSVTQTVVGQTREFSNFVLGVAVSDPQPGEHATQIYLGDGNEVVLRDIANTGPTNYALEIDEVSAGADGTTITVTDAEANVDSDTVDIVYAGVMSNSSDPFTILLTLDETAAGSGVFEKEFGLIASDSTLIGGPLEVSGGDTITGFYLPGARFEAVIDGAEQTDFVMLSDSLVSGGCNQVGDSLIFDQPIGNGIKIRLANSEFGTDTSITASISYANADLTGVDLELVEILYHNGISWSNVTSASGALDETAMTITGQVPAELISGTSEGRFSLGVLHDSCVGGAGGGFGRGLVVDAVAKVAKESSSGNSNSGSSGGGGGGGGGRSVSVSSSNPSTTASVSNGQEITATAEIEPRSGFIGGEVLLNFDNVVSPGALNVEERQVSPGFMFDTVESGHGRFVSGDSSFTSVGPLFDVKPGAGLQFQGTVEVTIPYVDALMSSLQSSDVSSIEDNVRFMHYDGSGWADLTISIDKDANTVTGRMSSFSQVVAAVVDDGTFGRLYFLDNPMDRLKPITAASDAAGTGLGFSDSQGNSVLSVSRDQDVTITATFQNQQRASQEYVYIMQVLDSRGIVMDIDIATGTIESAQAATIKDGSLHVGGEKTAYTIKVFLITPGNAPELLSDILVATIPVVNAS